MGRITLNLFLLGKRCLGGRPKNTQRGITTKEMEKLDCKRKAGLVANLNLMFPACRKRRSISLSWQRLRLFCFRQRVIFFQCVPFLLAYVVSDGGFSFYLSFMSVVADSVQLFIFPYILTFFILFNLQFRLLEAPPFQMRLIWCLN